MLPGAVSLVELSFTCLGALTVIELVDIRRPDKKNSGKLASPRAAGTLLTNAVRRTSLFPFSAPYSFLLKSKPPGKCRHFSDNARRTTPNKLPYRTSDFPREPTIELPIFLAPKLDPHKLGSIHWDRYLFHDPDNISRYPGARAFNSKAGGHHPMIFFCEFITTPTADTPGTSLIIHFDDKRYLFGHVPEGLQRACSHRNIRLSHVTDIFMSGRTSWTNNGGLLGIILTLAESVNTAAWSQREVRQAKTQRLKRLAEQTDNPEQSRYYRDRLELLEERNRQLAESLDAKGKLAIHGGPNLTRTVATARKFIFRTGMPVYINEFNEFSNEFAVGKEEEKGEGKGEGGERNVAKPTWTDSHLKVWVLSVSPTTSRGSPAGSAEGTKNGRKRSLDEFQEGAGAAAAPELGSEGKNVSDSDKRAQDQIVCQAVVSDMFNSAWRLDSLVEMRLPEVRLPANIFVRNGETHKLEPYTGPGLDGTQPVPDIPVLVRKPWPGAMTQTLPPTTPSDVSISYIIQHHDVRGKFNAAKAIALGVKKGPNFGKLASGRSVETSDGKIITPDMVLGETQPGGGLAFVDIPTPDYVENLVNRPEWTTPEVMRGLASFIWILGPGVGSHPLLREFVSKMSQYKHIVSSSDYCPNYLAFPVGSTETAHFSFIDNERFHLPHYNNEEAPQKTFLTPGPRSDSPTKDPLKSVFLPASPNLRVELQPKFQINSSGVHKPLDGEGIRQHMSSRVKRAARVANQDIQSPQFQEALGDVRRNVPNQDAEIITLGTGSSLPSKHRTVSATLLRVPGVGNYLFDCGENTLGQLQRAFSPEELREVLRDLRVIWISHLHADHHLGTVSVIRAWHEVTHGTLSSTAPVPKVEHDLTKLLSERRLFVASDAKMIEWLAEYSDIENYGFDKLLPLEADSSFGDNFNYSHLSRDRQPILDENGVPVKTHLSFNSDRSPFATQLQQATGLSSLLTVPVMHCHGSMATSFVFPSGFKVSYSGDCRPSREFAKIGADSTVLIHEATFEDDMLRDAKAKRHSTCGEALRVAERMRARNVILTHFSQRYTHKPTIPRLKIWDTFNHDSPSRSPSSSSAHSESGSQQPNRDQHDIGEVRANNPPDVPVSEDDPNNDNDSDYGSGSRWRDLILSGPLPDVMQLDGVPVPVIVAFDLLRVRVGDMLCAQRYVPIHNLYYDSRLALAAQYGKWKQRENKRAEADAGAGVDAGAGDVAKEKEKPWKK
ncbi:hypothetical protein ACJ73_03343 [Blastomyces percursus]|uniref:ribonuclease Z n=1 Tax=Blastomyces percursus TaxID=1658174 RepID=A0A1J9R9U3_9EURO|nr:hypothetical protein ACJ73_03343 [Blastomyces percursus]